MINKNDELYIKSQPVQVLYIVSKRIIATWETNFYGKEQQKEYCRKVKLIWHNSF